MKCFSLDILVFISALVLGSFAERNYYLNRRGHAFNMPEYESWDENQYNYDDITDEDIWQYHMAEEAGVVKITEKIYNEKLYGMKPGDKPWLIAIVYPGLMKGDK